jgi:hypothetical protein
MIRSLAAGIPAALLLVVVGCGDEPPAEADAGLGAMCEDLAGIDVDDTDAAAVTLVAYAGAVDDRQLAADLEDLALDVAAGETRQLRDFVDRMASADC